MINGKSSSVLADTAAKASILSARTCKRLFGTNYAVQPSSRRLIAYNDTNIAVLCELPAQVAYTGKEKSFVFPFWLSIVVMT